MKRNLFLILAIVVLALALFVSCDDATSDKKGNQEMTAFYAKAREAFRVSSGSSDPYSSSATFWATIMERLISLCMSS